MLSFIVSRNESRLTTAGIQGTGVLTTIVTWVRRASDATQDRPEVDLVVGGMEGNEHLEWARLNLQAGDTITIELREQAQVDEPERRRTQQEAGTDDLSILRAEIRHYEKHLTKLREQLALRKQE